MSVALPGSKQEQAGSKGASRPWPWPIVPTASLLHGARRIAYLLICLFPGDECNTIEGRGPESGCAAGVVL